MSSDEEIFTPEQLVIEPEEVDLEVEEERSSDGDDDGQDLADFIVPDDALSDVELELTAAALHSLRPITGRVPIDLDSENDDDFVPDNDEEDEDEDSDSGADGDDEE